MTDDTPAGKSAGPTGAAPEDADDTLGEFRKQYVTAEAKAQDDYDKSVLALSGGALGISFAFIKDIVGPGAIERPLLLLGAWAAWGLSIVVALLSYWFSVRAFRIAIGQIDDGTIRKQLPGRGSARATNVLNALGGVLFVAGVFSIVAFVASNIDRVHRGDKPTDTPLPLRDAELKMVYSVGPFVDADSTLSSGGWAVIEQSILDALKRQQSRRSVDAVLLLGGVDRRALSPAAAGRFGSNQALAMARAEALRARLLRHIGDSTSVIVMAVGALELGAARTGLELGRDRRVDVYFLLGDTRLRQRAR